MIYRQMTAITALLTVLISCGMPQSPLNHTADSTSQIRSKTFTLASYNIENLFDQTDDSHNSHYGDYRIKANSRGQYSNYGDTVKYHGKRMTFTEVKIAHIVQVLESLPKSPSIIGFQEVEHEGVFRKLFEASKELGYRYMLYATPENKKAPAVGVGYISKFPITASEQVHFTMEGSSKAFRPILKATFDIFGNDFTVYNGHWPSKGATESFRMAAATAVQENIDRLPNGTDYAIIGDLNSDYNEDEILEDRHNDTNGKTGINDVLKARGNEDKVASGRSTEKYNLYYELDEDERKSSFHRGFGWSSFDHIIVSKTAYDQKGIDYVDNSFEVANYSIKPLEFLFKRFNGEFIPRRWNAKRDDTYTVHFPDGYSDHLPVWAQFRVAN